VIDETQPHSLPYEGNEMNTHETHHLTAEELDAILDGQAVGRVAAHVAECTLCHTMVELDRQVVVDAPDVRGREGILRVHVKKVPLAENVELPKSSRGKPVMTGADLAKPGNDATVLAPVNR
jgi:SpoVK/Ycf46/Vps4 family AAA+-type ATPase